MLLAVNAGAGARLLLTDYVGVRGDLCYFRSPHECTRHGRRSRW
jgi:hypothetical protein